MVTKDTRNFSGSWIVKGQIHDPIPLNSENTMTRRGTYRIDGKGDDQQNAGIDLELAVPIRYLDRQ